MGHLLRFVGLIIAGSIGGFMLCSLPLAARNIDGAVKTQLLGAVLGAYIGFGVEMLIRLLIRRKWKFSIAEALVAMAILAALLVLYQALSTAYRGN